MRSWKIVRHLHALPLLLSSELVSASTLCTRGFSWQIGSIPCHRSASLGEEPEILLLWTRVSSHSFAETATKGSRTDNKYAFASLLDHASNQTLFQGPRLPAKAETLKRLGRISSPRRILGELDLKLGIRYQQSNALKIIFLPTTDAHY